MLTLGPGFFNYCCSKMYLFESQLQTHTHTQKQVSFIFWLTPHKAATVRVEPIQNEEPGSSLGWISHMGAGTQALSPYSTAFLGTLTGSQIVSKATKIGTNA